MTNEEHWLLWALDGYVLGKLELEEYEASVAHILAGGGVDFDGRVNRLVMPRPSPDSLTAVRR